MRSITENDAQEIVPAEALEALELALHRFNRLIDLGEYPPFKRARLGESDWVIDLNEYSTAIGQRFEDAHVAEYWRVNTAYSETDDGEELRTLFTDAFTTIFDQFRNEIEEAKKYERYFQTAERAIIAYELLEDPRLENGWGMPESNGTYRCEQCEIDYPDLMVDVRSDYRCDECNGPLEFDFMPEITGGDEDGYVGRAGTLRRLANRVVEGIGARRTGEAASATTRQILRESPLGVWLRNVSGKTRR